MLLYRGWCINSESIDLNDDMLLCSYCLQIIAHVWLFIFGVISVLLIISQTFFIYPTSYRSSRVKLCELFEPGQINATVSLLSTNSTYYMVWSALEQIGQNRIHPSYLQLKPLQKDEPCKFEVRCSSLKKKSNQKLQSATSCGCTLFLCHTSKFPKNVK